MEITLKVYKTKYKLKNFTDANVAAKAVLKRRFYSNLEYTVRDNSFFWQGTIDLEPYSFHAPNINCIVTKHIKTVCFNLLKENRQFLLCHIDKVSVFELLSLLTNENFN